MALDLLTAQLDGGPCLDSYGSGRPVPPVPVAAAHADAPRRYARRRRLPLDQVARAVVDGTADDTELRTAAAGSG